MTSLLEALGSTPDEAMRMEMLLLGYNAKQAAAEARLRALLDSQPELFFGVAFRWMSRFGPGETATNRFLASLALVEGRLLPLLVEPRTLSHEEAVILIHTFAQNYPGAEATLLERLIERSPAGDAPTGFFRVVEIVAGLDTVGRTRSILVRYLRSQDPKIRSKAAESLMRLTKSAETASSLLKDPDSRVQANVLEGLWPQAESRPVQLLFRQHINSPVPRIALNALVGLHRGGDAESAARIIGLATSPNVPMQRAAIWAMGFLSEQEFEAPLREILRGDVGELKGPVLRALVRINGAKRHMGNYSQAEQLEYSAIGRMLSAGAMEWNQWRQVCREPQPSLEGECFRNMDLTGVDLSYCRLRGADFSKACLNLANLFGADLRDADLSETRLNHADLRAIETSADTRFDRAEFRGAALHGVCLNRN